MDRLHLVDKPEGWTSHDAVARLRTILGERRVGHAGTLDPFATGLLVAAEGRATGLLAAIGLLPKRYRAVVRFGVATDTQDRTGRPRAPGDGVAPALPSADAIDDALAAFRGPLEQIPPLFSAVRVGGERLYRAARRGDDVERAARPIHVYALERLSDAVSGLAESGPVVAPPPSGDVPTLDVAIDLTVSRGTYVRTLAHDLGERLGCGAHLAALRRVGIGPFDVADAGRVERGADWDAARFRAKAFTPARALAFLPLVRLDAAEAARLRHGAAPSITEARVGHLTAAGSETYPLPPGASGWPLALLDPAGDLLALAAPWIEQTPGEPLALLRVVGAEDAPPRRRAARDGDAASMSEAARA